MCTSILPGMSASRDAKGKSGNAGFGLGNWLGNTVFDPADWAARKMGYAGDGVNFEHQLQAKLAGGETNAQANARAMGEEATEAARLSKTYHGSPIHAKRIAKEAAGPTVRPIAGRTNTAG